MTSKIIQFHNGLKCLKDRNLNTKSKNDKEKAKKANTSHTMCDTLILKELQKECRRVTFIGMFNFCFDLKISKFASE